MNIIQDLRRRIGLIDRQALLGAGEAVVAHHLGWFVRGAYMDNANGWSIHCYKLGVPDKSQLPRKRILEEKLMIALIRPVIIRILGYRLNAISEYIDFERVNEILEALSDDDKSRKKIVWDTWKETLQRFRFLNWFLTIVDLAELFQNENLFLDFNELIIRLQWKNEMACYDPYFQVRFPRVPDLDKVVT